MNNNKYRYALYAIVAVIIAVIGIQVYWNILNYKSNKQQLINDVQVSLDNAVDTYYNDLAEQNTLGLSFNDNDSLYFFENDVFDSIISKIDFDVDGIKNLDSLAMFNDDRLTILKGRQADSLFPEGLNSSKNSVVIEEKNFDSTGNQIGRKNFKFTEIDTSKLNGMVILSNDSSNTRRSESKILSDSLRLLKAQNINVLTSKIVISITSDSITLSKLDTIFNRELKRKKIDIDYGIKFIKKDSTISYLNENLVTEQALKTESKSSFLPKGSDLNVFFGNPTKEVLYRSLTGILISMLLVLSVIAILFYLLNIIRNQKQLAEMKNDLISNITHEFKTPIATVGVALESMKNFNALDDKEKAQQYINMSETQMTKLNTMVEKLLETASLDSDNLSLNFETINLNDLVESIVANHQIQAENKTIEFISEKNEITLEADAFHLENAISNLVDNAIKYGGNKIKINLKQSSSLVKLNVKDNGTTLNKSEASRIFDKFYRVPKGDTHDVKGFGIGLYYTKKIVEKHGGSIKLNLNQDSTNFKITLPNAR